MNACNTAMAYVDACNEIVDFVDTCNETLDCWCLRRSRRLCWWFPCDGRMFFSCFRSEDQSMMLKFSKLVTTTLFENVPNLLLQASLFSLTFGVTDSRQKRIQLFSLFIGGSLLLKSGALDSFILQINVPRRLPNSCTKSMFISRSRPMPFLWKTIFWFQYFSREKKGPLEQNTGIDFLGLQFRRSPGPHIMNHRWKVKAFERLLIA